MIDNYKEIREEIARRVLIPEYFSDNIDSSGEINYKNLITCPLHGDSNPSFKYFKDTNSFYCFGCQKGGSVVELHYYYVKKDDPSYTKERAIKDLIKMYELDIHIDRFSTKKDNINKNIMLKEKNRVKVDSMPKVYLIKESEKKLKMLKNKDIDKYIQKANELDLIYMFDVDLNEYLGKFLLE